MAAIKCVMIFHGDPAIVLELLQNIDIEFAEGPYNNLCCMYSLKFYDSNDAILVVVPFSECRIEMHKVSCYLQFILFLIR